MRAADAKALLETSAASEGDPDSTWCAEASSRLYFHDPNRPETSGAVDVSDGNPTHVSLHLWIPVDAAAEVVKYVTGRRSKIPAPKPIAHVETGRTDTSREHVSNAPRADVMELPALGAPPPKTLTREEEIAELARAQSEDVD